MLIFDEKKYAENLLKNKEFKTYRQKDIERYVLIRYLYFIGMEEEEIKKQLAKFPFTGCEYLDKVEVDYIYDKILQKALSRPLVTGIEVDIYDEEMEIIENIEDINVKKLLFILLVYYKWACQQSYLKFFSRYNNVDMVITNDIDVWKNAGIMNLRTSERYKLCNKLIEKGLYVEDNFKANNYFYLPFCQKSGKIAIKITNYDNILGELFYFEDKNHYKRCSNCGVVITKTRSPKKYCSSCAKEIKNKQNLKYYNLGKTKVNKSVVL